MFEESIIKKILDVWSADQADPLRGRAKRQLPGFTDVKEVVEMAFLASIRREEGRQICISIVLASPAEIEDSSHRYRRNILRFKESLPFTEDSIVKLAPAFDPTLASIAVDRDSIIKELRIWGVFYYQPTAHRFNEIPVVTEGGTFFRPDLFTVTIRGPGSLQISRMNSNIGRFLKGDFLPATPTPFASHSLGKYLLEFIKPSDLWKKYNMTSWHYYHDALEVLLLEAASRGHGATIILLPPKGIQICEGFFVSKYQLEPRLRLLTHIEEPLKYGKEPLMGVAYRKVLLESLQALAQLSTVDGALVLTNELDLVTFGATLQAPKWSGATLIGPDGFGAVSGEPFTTQRYGTRHNSAINFAAACQGSIVFVISEDGPIRAFARLNEQVLCWPDCTESMFV